jgi:hypothetical protein
MNLLQNAKVNVLYRGSTAVAATDITCTGYVDMDGYDGVMLITSIIETTAGATTTNTILTPTHGNVATTSTHLTNLGTTARAGGATSTAEWGKALVVDIYKPLKRYVGARILKTGAGTVATSAVFAVQYKNRKGAVTQAAAEVKGSKQAISPTT